MSEITVWRVVAWLFGIFGVIMGLIAMILEPLTGLPLIAAGLFVLPLSRAKIESTFDIELTDWTVIGLYCSFFGVAILFHYMFYSGT